MKKSRTLKIGDWDPMQPDKVPDSPPSGPDDSAMVPRASIDDKDEANLNPLMMLAFDPWRLWMLLQKRWWVFILTGVIGLVLGVLVGLWKTETVYTVNVRFIIKDFSSAFRSNRLGEAYAPSELRPATLISTASSFAAIKRVSVLSGVDVSTLRSSYEFKQQRKTDLMILTVWTRKSKESTAELANLWSRELVEYTRELQARESRDVRKYLEEQVRSIDLDVAAIERNILLQVQESGTVNPEKEIEAYLRSLTGLELEYHNARIELDAMDDKIAIIQEALKYQSPTVEQLRKLQEKYKVLLSQYTEANPLVKEAEDNIRQLEKQIRQERESGNVGEDAFTGTGISDALYLELKKLRNEQDLLEKRKEELEILVKSSKDHLQSIPRKAMVYQQLTGKKSSLLNARELLFSRLQEAQLFEDKAPGYLNVVASVTPEEVRVTSSMMKTAIAGCALFMIFLGGSVVLLSGYELLSPELKTSKELQYLFRSEDLINIPPSGVESVALAEQLMLWKQLKGEGYSGRPHLVWVPYPLQDENLFWKWCLDQSALQAEYVVLLDLGNSSPLAGASWPKYERGQSLVKGVSYYCSVSRQLTLPDMENLYRECLQLSRQQVVFWVRLNGELNEFILDTASRNEALTILAEPGSVPRKEWRMHAKLLLRLLPAPPRVVALNHKNLWPF